MKKILLTISIILGIFAQSCVNETESQLNQEIQSQDDIKYLNITYKGICYKNIPTKYNSKGEFIFLDDIFSKIYNDELKDLSTLSTLLIDESNIAFYHSLDELLTEQQLTIVELPFTRSSISTFDFLLNVLAGIELYDDKNLSDTKKEFILSSDITYLEVSDLKGKDQSGNSYGFNDKCSSLQITNNLPNDSLQTITVNNFNYRCTDINLVFIGYDDKNFSDNRIVCVAPAATSHKHNELPGFNDKLSSFQLSFAHKSQFSENLTPHK